jgi:hypothetical protein
MAEVVGGEVTGGCSGWPKEARPGGEEPRVAGGKMCPLLQYLGEKRRIGRIPTTCTCRELPSITLSELFLPIITI